MSRNRKLLGSKAIEEVAEPAPERPELPVFTDDYYNLLRILK